VIRTVRDGSVREFCLPMRKSHPSLARVTAETRSFSTPQNPGWQRWLVRFLGCVVIVYLAWLGVVEVLRVQFPWDLYVSP